MEVVVFDCNNKLLPFMVIGRNERLTTCTVEPELPDVAVLARLVKKSVSSEI